MTSYILKKVVVYLTQQDCAEQFEGPKVDCERRGILFCCRSVDDILQNDRWMDVFEESTLTITDSPKLYHLFREKGLQVLVYLHALNYNADFPKARYAMEHPEDLGCEYFERILRRFHNVPWDILETKRCFLRETTEEDVPSFFEIYSNKEITRYMEDLYPTVEEEMEYIAKYRKYVYEFYEHGVWTVLDQETGEIIGRAGIAVREGYEEPEICFMTAVPFQRKGIATEVVRAIMAYGQEYFGYEEYIAFVDPKNEVSKILLEHLGFTYEKEVFLMVEEAAGRNEQSFWMYRNRMPM